MIKQIKRFHFKTEIFVKNGAAREVGSIAKDMGANRYLMVIDPAIKDNGLAAPAIQSLDKAGVQGEIFSDIEAEPYLDGAEQAAVIGRDQDADIVIGLGGGSAMDTAKAASALITNGGNAEDYVGLNLLKKPGLKTIMIPTTAGTGAEVTFTAVFTNRQTKAKGGINSDFLFPDVAVLDPELTLTCPPMVTAYTGMDALTHAIESLSGKASTPFTTSLGLEAVRLISGNLRRAVYNGEDIQARENMLIGSLLGGMALADAGVGAAHALAYPLGGNYRIPHGLANAVMIPYVMDYNLPAAIESYALIARSMDLCYEISRPRDLAEMAVGLVMELCEDIGLPTTMRELDVPESDIPELAPIAMKVARPLDNNPRFVSEKDAIRIYDSAYQGVLGSDFV